MTDEAFEDDPEVRRMAEQLRRQTQRENTTKQELGDVVEELFGANLRSLRTLWVAFRHPARYAKAALSPDWESGRYTPSVRLYLAIFSVFALTAFLWFDRFMAPGELDEVMIGERTLMVMFLGVSFAWTLFGAWLLRWRGAVGFATNIRLWFAASIPPTTISYFDEIQGAFHPPEWGFTANVISFAIFIIAQFAYLRLGPARALAVASPNRLIAKYLLVLYTLGLVIVVVTTVIIMIVAGFISGFSAELNSS